MSGKSILNTLPGWPVLTAGAILRDNLEAEVRCYHRGQQSGEFVWLDLPELREAVKGGEVRFGSRDLPPPKVELAVASRAAAEAVKDGAVLMFVDDHLIKDLDETVEVSDESRVRFLRIFAQRGM